MENLLNWTKNDIVRLEPDFSQVDVPAVLNKVLYFFEQAIKIKGIRVSKLFDSPKIFIRSDENMMTVVLRNIISNGIKYNHLNGGLIISVRTLDHRTEIIVEDTGIGMNEDRLNKIFEYSNDSSRGTSGEASFGIGMMLTREFVEKLNAEIEFSSKPGKGTVVKLIFNKQDTEKP